MAAKLAHLSSREVVHLLSWANENGCWIWQRGTSPSGYGNWHSRGVHGAHRLSYVTFKGPIPSGYDIDHLCQVTTCVNPDHLEAVTPEENRRRQTQRRTHCVHGHEFTTENTRMYRGSRACRRCHAAKQRAYMEARRTPRDPNCCRRGHGFTAENTRIESVDGRPARRCRQCIRDRRRERAERGKPVKQ